MDFSPNMFVFYFLFTILLSVFSNKFYLVDVEKQPKHPPVGRGKLMDSRKEIPEDEIVDDENENNSEEFKKKYENDDEDEEENEEENKKQIELADEEEIADEEEVSDEGEVTNDENEINCKSEAGDVDETKDKEISDEKEKDVSLNVNSDVKLPDWKGNLLSIKRIMVKKF